jgi:hypothetical protein
MNWLRGGWYVRRDSEVFKGDRKTGFAGADLVALSKGVLDDAAFINKSSITAAEVAQHAGEPFDRDGKVLARHPLVIRKLMIGGGRAPESHRLARRDDEAAFGLGSFHDLQDGSHGDWSRFVLWAIRSIGRFKLLG